MRVQLFYANKVCGSSLNGSQTTSSLAQIQYCVAHPHLSLCVKLRSLRQGALNLAYTHAVAFGSCKSVVVMNLLLAPSCANIQCGMDSLVWLSGVEVVTVSRQALGSGYLF